MPFHPGAPALAPVVLPSTTIRKGVSTMPTCRPHDVGQAGRQVLPRMASAGVIAALLGDPAVVLWTSGKRFNRGHPRINLCKYSRARPTVFISSHLIDMPRRPTSWWSSQGPTDRRMAVRTSGSSPPSRSLRVASPDRSSRPSRVPDDKRQQRRHVDHHGQDAKPFGPPLSKRIAVYS